MSSLTSLVSQMIQYHSITTFINAFLKRANALLIHSFQPFLFIAYLTKVNQFNIPESEVCKKWIQGFRTSRVRIFWIIYIKIATRSRCFTFYSRCSLSCLALKNFQILELFWFYLYFDIHGLQFTTEKSIIWLVMSFLKQYNESGGRGGVFGFFFNLQYKLAALNMFKFGIPFAGQAGCWK